MIDISKFLFEDYVNFFFNREISKTKNEPWYYSCEANYDLTQILNFYINLFKSSNYLIGKFSDEQLESGFNAILSPTLDFSIEQNLWNNKVPYLLRSNLINSMFDLFNEFFSKVWFGGVSHMWWDGLVYGFHCGSLPKDNCDEDIMLQNGIFSVISKILLIKSEDCQVSALHGLGHLHHKDTEELINKFIKENEPLNNDIWEYANSAMKFEVL
jgi:hypothetical protein